MIEAAAESTSTFKMNSLGFVITNVLVQCTCLAGLIVGFYLDSDTDDFETGFAKVAGSCLKATRLSLHINLALFAFSICKYIRLLFERALHQVQKPASLFHRSSLCCIATLAVIHAVLHWIDFAGVRDTQGFGWKGILRLGFASGAGWSGHILLLTLFALLASEMLRRERVNTPTHAFEHKTYVWVVLFMLCSLHESFRMPATDLSPSDAEFPIWAAFGHTGSLAPSSTCLKEIGTSCIRRAR